MHKLIIIGIILSFAFSKTVTVDYTTDAVTVMDKIDLDVKDNLLVRLYTTPTTGYTWKVFQKLGATGSTILEEVSSSIIPSNSIMYGAPSLQEINLLAVNIGSEKVQLIYAREWEISDYLRNDGTFAAVKARKNNVNFEEKILTIRVEPGHGQSFLE